MKRLVSYFFKGLLFVIPIVVTLYIVYVIVNGIGGVFQYLLPSINLPDPIVKIIGFIFALITITSIGFLSSAVITKWLLNLINRLFTRLPLVKLIYSSVRDLINAFVGEKKKFNKPVLVNLSPLNNAFVLGFITREELDFFDLKDHVVVYLPQSYNFAGNLIILPRKQIKPIDKDSSEFMTFIVSGGITGK